MRTEVSRDITDRSRMCMFALTRGTGLRAGASWPSDAASGGTTMPGHEECPRWCAEDVFGPDGLLHRVVLGDVRLVQIYGATTCQVRRRLGRGPEEDARLHASLTAAARLMGLESRRRHVVFRGNWAVPAPEVARTVGGPARVGVAG